MPLDQVPYAAIAVGGGRWAAADYSEAGLLLQGFAPPSRWREGCRDNVGNSRNEACTWEMLVLETGKHDNDKCSVCRRSRLIREAQN
jgi:hypothetical protein